MEQLCSEIIATTKGVKAICKELGVDHATVRRWIADDEECRDMYARAKEMQAELMEDDLLEIADDSSGDAIVGPNGIMLNAEFVARSRLRVDTRKWLMSKLKPKKYGDKLQTELTGANGGPLLVVNRIAPAPENDPL